MKTLNLILLITGGILFSTVSLFSQFSGGINYQAVVRDIEGQVVANQPVVVKIEIAQSSIEGAVVYSEEHSLNTSTFGLVSLVIGKGMVLSGSFTSVPWGSNSYFLNISMNINGGGMHEYGSSELATVPYAYHAQTAGTVMDKNDADADPMNELINSFSLSGTNLLLNEGSNTWTLDLSGLVGGSGNADLDADPANELQDLRLSGNTLSITSLSEPTFIDLTPYLDNTDNQNLSLTGNILSLERGNSLNLSSFLDNTDKQTLSLDGSTLTISGGNSVVLPAGGSSAFIADANGYTMMNGSLGIGEASRTDRLISITSNTSGLLAQTSTSGQFGLKGISTGGGNNAAGVWGWGDKGGVGVYGEARSQAGVKGITWTDTEKAYGGYFTARGPKGVGVYGENTKSGAIKTYGGHFYSVSDSGVGVYAQSDNPAAYGVKGYSNKGTGVAGKSGQTKKTEDHTGLTGVYGSAFYSFDPYGIDQSGAYGGYFESNDIAVKGISVTSLSYGHTGNGEYGYTGGEGGSGIGGYFHGERNGSTEGGTGVIAKGGSRGIDATGWNYGVVGVSERPYATADNQSYYDENAAGVMGIGREGSHGVFGSGEVGVIGVGTTGVKAGGSDYDFYAGGSGTNYGPFTGAHDVLFSNDTPENLIPGMIVSNTGTVFKRKNKDTGYSLSSTLPEVKLSDKSNDKAVFGVLVKEKKLNKDHWHNDKSTRAGIVNALGEGLVWVCEVNGNIEAGDYITSSEVAGYGKKQEAAQLHNYTLAKATETVDWSLVQKTISVKGKKIKVYLIAVVYVSG